MKAAWALALVVAVILVVAVVALFVGRFREHKTPIGIDISMESGALRLSFSAFSASTYGGTGASP
jgi:hypothetical protein